MKMCIHSYIYYSIVYDYLLKLSLRFLYPGTQAPSVAQRLCYVTCYRPSLQFACLFGKPMAGHLMARCQFNQLRLFVLAAFRTVRATVAERTSRRQVQRTGRFAFDILNLLGKVHLGIKDRVQQCP